MGRSYFETVLVYNIHQTSTRLLQPLENVDSS